MPPSIAVIIPVRDGVDLLAPCLRSIVPQLDTRDELIVVDDGSTDGSDALAAELGATVLRNDRAPGPYAARNVGWQHTDRDVVLFTDMRCRAREHWMSTVRNMCEDEDVALACSDIEVIDGDAPAAKVMHHRQAFYSHHTNAERFFLPYFATCNLAVRRFALEAIAGFEEVRSGGDADLCWRIQLAGLGRFEALEDVTMDWVPRSGIRAFLRQWARYGRSQAQLRHRYPQHKATQPRPTVRRKVQSIVRMVGADLLKRQLPFHIAVVDGLAMWVYGTSLVNELRRLEHQALVTGVHSPAFAHRTRGQHASPTDQSGSERS